ncbi:hypothetical protein OPKNFCMD_1552 [Methylobacterium crusticola]|uniref:CsbD-like domain-containing protein n=1 Tax=Methylobacterium crusticola TaxID=1697972 RepID=A0ABQ4QU19_9HYPH|nr:CsbD family protein [Methylobacterium crusticola]GJD48826.1 hypothetical protein OPKNFCMD_1552 [Methylobacterium crusticola]
MDADRIIGAGKELGGKVQQGLGEVGGDAGTQARGAVNQAAGVAQNVYGQAKDAVRNLADAAPDYVDQARDVGRRTYDQGNSMLARQVGDQHLVALLLAGAVGYALGWLIHGRD